MARDGAALLAVLDGREWDEAVDRAGALLATVLGQDMDRDEAGVFRIARRVARDRVISTVDPETRHGHKTAARGFDGYKVISGSTRTRRSSPRPWWVQATRGTPPPPTS